MSLYDAQGREIRQVTDEQLINAINTLDQNNKMLQQQLMQFGMLIEYVIEQLGDTLTIDPTHYEAWVTKRVAEIQKNMEALRTRQMAPQLDLEE